MDKFEDYVEGVDSIYVGLKNLFNPDAYPDPKRYEEEEAALYNDKINIDYVEYANFNDVVVLMDPDEYGYDELFGESYFYEGDEDLNDDIENSEGEPDGSSEDVPDDVESDESADDAPSAKNGKNRKKLYNAFIDWAKDYNSKNSFGTVYDADAFNKTYPFVPDEMRYFYRNANPNLCVLDGGLTFFGLSELHQLNSSHEELDKYLIFAGTETDFRAFSIGEKNIHKATINNGVIESEKVLSDSFDEYIQGMVGKGDILSGGTTDDQSTDDIDDDDN